MKERATFSQLIIAEVIKHLPGQHSQLKHAGSHSVSQITEQDIALDNTATESLYRRIQDLLEGSQEHKDSEELTKDLVSKYEDWKKDLKAYVTTAKRFYRGVHRDLVEDILGGSYWSDKYKKTMTDYFGDNANDNLSLPTTIRPNIAKKFGKFTLILDGDAVRAHSYLPIESFTEDDNYVYPEEMEFAASASLPLSAILGIRTPNGSILGLGKK